MFYRKTDTEILCETLLSLADKQERFIERFGLEKLSPYKEALHAILQKTEKHLGLSSQPTERILPQHETLIAADPLATPKTKKKYKRRKAKRKYTKGNYFKGKRPAVIEVLHGHSDDPKDRPLPHEGEETTNAVDTTLANQAEEKKEEIATPDNIEKFSEQLASKFEPFPKEDESKLII